MKTCKMLMLATVFYFAAGGWNAGIALAAVDSFLDFTPSLPPPPPPPPKTTTKSSHGSTTTKAVKAGAPAAAKSGGGHK